MKVEKDLSVMELTSEMEETGDKQDKSFHISQIQKHENRVVRQRMAGETDHALETKEQGLHKAGLD